jgi:hypothetical protein
VVIMLPKEFDEIYVLFGGGGKIRVYEPATHALRFRSLFCSDPLEPILKFP